MTFTFTLSELLILYILGWAICIVGFEIGVYFEKKHRKK
jgi:hypothetical protein